MWVLAVLCMLACVPAEDRHVATLLFIAVLEGSPPNIVYFVVSKFSDNSSCCEMVHRPAFTKSSVCVPDNGLRSPPRFKTAGIA